MDDHKLHRAAGTDDASDASAVQPALERDIRRLRFKDRTLERAFQDDYAERRVPQFKIAFWVAILIQIPAAVRFRFVLHVGPTDWWHIILSRWGGVVPPVIGLLLARAPRAAKWLPTYMVGFVLLTTYFLVNTTAQVPASWTTLSTIIVAFCIMSRMRAREAILVELLIIGWYSFVSVATYHRPVEFLLAPLLSLGVLAVFVAAANYMIESSARRDFVLRRQLSEQKERSERLLLNVLPAPIAQRLKESPGTIADRFDEITVLFAAIAEAESNVAQIDPAATVELLNDVFTAFDELAHEHGLEKIKTIGYAYMAVGGLPEPRDDHAQAVVAMALDMQRVAERFTWPNGDRLLLRIGVNTGPAVAGVIGTTKFAYDLWGDTVNVASRMESQGIAGAIQLTHSTHRRVRRNHRCTKRTVNVKGKGPMPVYVLQPASPNGTRSHRRRASAVHR